LTDLELLPACEKAAESAPPSRGGFCCRSLKGSDSLLNQNFLKFVIDAG